MVFVVTCLMNGTGKTQITGYVVNVEQTSWPWERTKVTFTYEHPTSFVDAVYFTKVYGGHHEFELHERYTITAWRPWYWAYPKIHEARCLQGSAKE